MNSRFKTWPDYKNCISNFPNSIMRYFDVPTEDATLPALDAYLNREYKNVVVILLDGMGVNILNENLEKDGFFCSHLKNSYSSTFPPTTVAATTSILSGRMPCEHGWLGWDCYYPQIDKNVTVFFNVVQGTEEPAADYNVPYRYTGYENIISRFEKAGKEAHFIAPFFDPFPDSFPKISDRIKDLCKKDGRKYIYAYFDQPDTTMHDTGCFSEISKDTVKELERQVKALCDELEDTLVIVTADHGHINTRSVSITDYPTITDCLVRLPSIEPRALNLFVKPDKKEFFEKEFDRFFGNDFVLMTKQEVLDSHLFGTGKEHDCLRGMLGDYLAVAIGDLTIFNTEEEAEHFIGVHAGLTEDEMAIPLVIIDCPADRG